MFHFDNFIELRMKSTLLTYSTFIQKPWGRWIAGFQNGRLCYLSLNDKLEFQNWAKKCRVTLHKIKMPVGFHRELKTYLKGKLKRFSFPTVFLDGTPFERKVWKTLRSIPYGEVRSYAWVARKIGFPKAARAVGRANGKNPIPIVIPCHRVISSDGKIGGYSGGVALKRKLLKLEGVKL